MAKKTGEHKPHSPDSDEKGRFIRRPATKRDWKPRSAMAIGYNVVLVKREET